MKKKILEIIKSKKKVLKIIGLTAWALVTFALVITVSDLANTPHYNTIVNDNLFRVALIDYDNDGYYDTIDIVESEDKNERIDFKLTTVNGVCLFEGTLDENITHIQDDLLKEYKVNEGDVENDGYADLLLDFNLYFNKDESVMDNTYKIEVFENCSYILDWEY